MKIWTAPILALAIAVGGCELVQPYPELPTTDNPATSFDLAIQFAKDTRGNYRHWLEGREEGTLWAGTGALLMSGAALALGAVGGSTLAVTALTTASAATIATDQWIVGSPAKSPKTQAYSNAISQLDCVIHDAQNLIPRTPGEDGPAKPETAADTLKKANDASVTQTNIVTNLLTSVPAGSPAASDARLAIAYATASQNRMQVFRTALVEAPGDIDIAVRAIDSAAFQQAEAGAADITALPKISAPSKSPGTSTTPRTPAAAAFNATQLTDSVTALRKQTDKDDDMLAGKVPQQPGFAECMKAGAKPAQSGQSKTTGSSATDSAQGNQPSATPAAKLSVLPSTQIYAAPGKGAQTISISGGKPPYDLIVVDPGMDAKRGGASGGSSDAGGSNGSSIDIKLSDNSLASSRLLVTDSAGTQLIVNVTKVQIPSL